MLTLQSPHNNQNMNNSVTNSKMDLLSNISPTFRNKRIPSAHDNYSYSSNHNLKIIKTQSPSKCSQKLKRRKSQYINTNSYVDTNPVVPQKKKSSKLINQNSGNMSNPIISLNTNLSSQNTKQIGNTQFGNSQNIIGQMNFLKNQYKQLKAAYKQLIQQKINNAQKMAQMKQDKRKIQLELQLALNNRHAKQQKHAMYPLQYISIQEYKDIKNENIKLKQKNCFFQSQLDRIKKQCYKLLQTQKYKSKKLEETLKEKDQLIKISKQKLFICGINQNEYSSCGKDLGIMYLNEFNNNNSSSKMMVHGRQEVKNNSTPKMVNAGMKDVCIQKQKGFQISNLNHDEESLFISQEKGLQNQSQFISISLTSVMQQSSKVTADEFQMVTSPNCKQKNKQPLFEINLNSTQSSDTVLNKQSTKVDKQSSRGLIQGSKNIIIQDSNKVDKEQVNNQVKKMRKQVHQKLQINLNHFDNKKDMWLNMKTPMSSNGVDKKNLSTKNKNSKSKKKQIEDKENITACHHSKQNVEGNGVRNMKKKDKNHSVTCK